MRDDEQTVPEQCEWRVQCQHERGHQGNHAIMDHYDWSRIDVTDGRTVRPPDEAYRRGWTDGYYKAAQERADAHSPATPDLDVERLWAALTAFEQWAEAVLPMLDREAADFGWDRIEQAQRARTARLASEGRPESSWWLKGGLPRD